MSLGPLLVFENWFQDMRLSRQSRPRLADSKQWQQVNTKHGCWALGELHGIPSTMIYPTTTLRFHSLSLRHRLRGSLKPGSASGNSRASASFPSFWCIMLQCLPESLASLPRLSAMYGHRGRGHQRRPRVCCCPGRLETLSCPLEKRHTWPSLPHNRLVRPWLPQLISVCSAKLAAWRGRFKFVWKGSRTRKIILWSQYCTKYKLTRIPSEEEERHGGVWAQWKLDTENNST